MSREIRELQEALRRATFEINRLLWLEAYHRLHNKQWQQWLREIG